ncbi:MAG: DUF861 domain-containing protein [Spirochaetaceae bacterium]|nr:MAG: DUF861 domain-containing protein [Spirochaetaceae bacterium]
MQPSKNLYTEAEVRKLASQGVGVLHLRPDDLITPLAQDTARELGMRIERVAAAPPATAVDAPSPGSAAQAPGRLVARDLIRCIDTRGLSMPPFEFDIGRPEMDVRGVDVVTSDDNSPVAAGFLSLRQGSFPWTLNYDEVQYVLEGELHIGTKDGPVIGRPGDVLFIPKGSSITFGTPNWAKFFYVTYPANWASSGEGEPAAPSAQGAQISQGAPTATATPSKPVNWDRAAEFPVKMDGPRPHCITCGQVPDRKPEHMTQLDAETFAPKNAPRIRLRGRLDTLNAVALRCAALASVCGFQATADRIATVAAYCRELMSAEYHARVPAPLQIAGMDEAQLREATHKPVEMLGIGHIAPDANDHALLLELNYLRAQVREVEVTALDAEIGTEIVAGLNRLSSAVYLVELLLARDDLKRGGRS